MLIVEDIFFFIDKFQWGVYEVSHERNVSISKFGQKLQVKNRYARLYRSKIYYLAENVKWLQN